MTDLSPQDLALLKLVLKGRSVIDSHRLLFKNDDEVRDFLKVNEFDLDRPKDLERLRSIQAEAVAYLQRELQFGIAPELLKPFEDGSEVLVLFKTASDIVKRDRTLQTQACGLLKTMNIVNHIDGRELLYNCPISLRDLFSLAEDKIERSLSSLSLSDPSLLRYKGGRKPKESVITKLLCKRETIAAQVYDRVRYRIVTRKREDIMTVLLHLFHTVLPFNYVIPGASVNQLISLKEKNRLEAHFGKLRKVLSGSAKSMEYSGKNYKVCKFVVDIPVRMDNFLAQSGGSVYRESLGSIAYVLVEFQIVDEAAEAGNNTGESSHENYKKRQKRGVLRRLTGK
ncbi:MAG TPA: TIGR04552 family protein [bacterium]|nr:TIGR04552 family protein [bacterium]